jgi:hypothetical protein
MVERTVEDEALLREAFTELLATPQPVTVDRLAERLGTALAETERRLARLDEHGWIRRNEAGAVVGSRGLSIEPTRHELELDGARRFTWCAYDTVGIFGALGATGTIRSRTPLDEPVELQVVAGRPAGVDGVVLFFPHRQVSSVVEEWCPLANFFLDEQAALAWARRQAIDGEVLTLAEASERGAAEWRDCCLA